MERLFTVTADGKPIAVVLANDFAEAVRVGAVLCRIAPEPPADAPPALPVRPLELRARKPNGVEGYRFAAEAAKFKGGARLAGIPL